MNQRFFDKIGVSKFPAKMGKEATFWGSIAFACHSWRYLWPCPCFEKGAIRVKKVTRFSIRHKTTFSAAQAAFSGKHTKKPSSLNKETFTNFCNADAVQQSSPFQLGLRQWKTFFNFQRLLSFGDSWHAVLQGLKLWRNKVFQFRSHLKFFLKHYFHIFSTANSVLYTRRTWEKFWVGLWIESLLLLARQMYYHHLLQPFTFTSKAIFVHSCLVFEKQLDIV